MGNRPSRKKQRASAAVSAPSEEAVAAAPAPSPAASAQPESALAARKYESPAKRKESELPLSARQAPPTARDDGNNEDDPLQFFRQCYALEEDPFALYTQALLLKDQREFAAARYRNANELVQGLTTSFVRYIVLSELLRSLLPNASLSLEAHYHLAQCLVAQDPALRSCREEATQCLESVVVATKASSTSADAHQAIMYRDSLELLAHVMIAGRRFDRALELLDLLQAHINTDAVPPNQAAYRQQQTLVSFQRAFCRYARGDPPEAISSELLGVPPHKPEQQQGEEQDELEVPDPLESIELLLHADAASLHEGFALLVATST